MIQIKNLQKAFGLQPILEEAHYVFPQKKRIALVGPNGAGKSTLLNLLVGLEEPDAGKVIVPQGAIVSYLPQEPNPDPKATVLMECLTGRSDILLLKQKLEDATQAMEESPESFDGEKYEKLLTEFQVVDGYSLEGRARTILRGLGFSELKIHENPIHLSGGWRMRLELAKIFLRDADFLILDEPTNHLDLPSMVWVESFLEKFQGTLLVVSHDVTLLNKLSQITIELEAGKLTPYSGNFDAYLEQKAAREAQQDATRENISQKIEHLEKFVNRFGAKASKAKQAQSKMKTIARLQVEFDAVEKKETSKRVAFSLPDPGRLPRVVAVINNGSIGYDTSLARGIELQVERGDKVAIIGANGIGKTTLLKTLAGKIPGREGSFQIAPNVSMSFFAQSQLEVFDEDKTVIENALQYTSLSEKEARSHLGSFLFSGDAIDKKTKVLSGGEKSRLGLACLLASGAGFLILDEPTNHLDMYSVTVLTEALASFKGTVLFVSHNRIFIDAVCNKVFAMLEDGRSQIFEGDLSDYKRLSGVSGFPDVLSPAQDDELSSAEIKTGKKINAKELRKEFNALVRRIQSIEKTLETSKANLVDIDARMNSTPPNNYDELSGLQNDKDACEESISELEMEWMELEEEKEEFEITLKENNVHV